MSPSTLRHVVAALLVVTSTVGATRSEAQESSPSSHDRERARQLVYEGRQHKDRGDTTQAITSFQKAHMIMGVPTTALELARAQIAARKLVAARGTLEEMLKAPSKSSDPPAFAKARAEARALLDAFALSIGTVTVIATTRAGGPPSGVSKLTVDGDSLMLDKLGAPIDVDPGSHEVVVIANNTERRETVRVGEGGSETVRLTFERETSPVVTSDTSTKRWTPATSIPPQLPKTRTNPLTYVGAVVGVLAVGAGAVTGGLALSTRSAVGSRCSGSCPKDVLDDIERGQMLGTVSTAAFATAGVAAVVMVYGLLQPRRTVEKTIAAAFGPQGAQF